MSEGWGTAPKRRSRVKFDSSHNKSVRKRSPTPPPHFEEDHIDIAMGTGSRKYRSRRAEGHLLRWSVFRELIRTARANHPERTQICLTFEEVHPDGGVQVLNWIDGRDAIECVEDCVRTSTEFRMLTMFEAAATWGLTPLKKEILDIVRNKVKKRNIGDVRLFIEMMSGIYAVASKNDQDDVSDTINAALRAIPVGRWFYGIKKDNDPSFYRRLAGLAFRDISVVLLDTKLEIIVVACVANLLTENNRCYTGLVIPA
ncbi:hypothetical protein TWF730_003626 [Orbilia blumenaviensis]|uniref:Uncharacterized protein n=1 Tax=Orbilia blumenaviensis TaxID=1796055 RepID=A0AAV9U730_9PEZI